MSASVWPMLEAERRSFIDYLRTVPDSDWDKPSLCKGWTVKDVLAHSVAAAKNTPPSFLGGMIGAGFNFNLMNERRLNRLRGKSPGELIDILDSRVSKHTQPGKAMLGEVIIHREDIRRPVGSPANEYPAEHIIALADYYKKAGPPLGNKKRISGFTLKATDHDWSTGEGPVVSGPLTSLLLAMTGRPAGLVDLGGDGLPAFAERVRSNPNCATP